MSLASTFVIKQGSYDLTEAAMRLRSQRPLHSEDDYQFDFEYVDEDGNAIDITGATITFTAKYALTDVDGSAIVKKTGAIVVAADGTFSVTLTDGDVAGPEYIRGYYDVQITIGSTTPMPTLPPIPNHYIVQHTVLTRRGNIQPFPITPSRRTRTPISIGISPYRIIR